MIMLQVIEATAAAALSSGFRIDGVTVGTEIGNYCGLKLVY